MSAELLISVYVLDPVVMEALCSQTALTTQECLDLGLDRLKALIRRINFAEGQS